MSGEEYINAPILIHKTAKRYHFLLRFIDSAPSIFPFIGRSAIRHSPLERSSFRLLSKIHPLFRDHGAPLINPGRNLSTRRVARVSRSRARFAWLRA